MYVIMIDGEPRMKEGSTMRTYKTKDTAEKWAREITRYWSYKSRKVEIAEVSFSPIKTIGEGGTQ
ncbi:hypothetical protein [Paenibacillus larvae]|uniref:Uncharacterized protein n=1 Tax=Paenibacillus larvae subsp. larvae TaxID=147375 RepID=A0A6C0QUB8_9BACL|nr:hypothetical protein [Paenibacillus larvae]QHZ51158.1 hypothetical protein ERICV_02010 [Paenibacillus larvae subsp. larvae]QHZ52345.1 hypothetical protein ERICV_03233 [Paenibacillus larvae subsp. larvae]